MGVAVMRHRYFGAASAAVCLVVLSTSVLVSGAASASTKPDIPAPAGLPSFYSVPQPLPKGPVGTLIKSEVVPDANLVGATMHIVMYKSKGPKKAVPVTGMVAIPNGTPPAGGWPVVTWGHGTNGMADVCAPSLQGASQVPGINNLIAAGYAVTASDYQGEGTPGLMPYVVGASAAEDTVMIVKAAHSLPGVSLSPNYVVWGHSEGGQTAMFSIYDHKYAPKLNLRGVVAGAPPSQFSLLYDFLVTSPFDYYLMMVAGSYNSYYGSTKAPLSAIMTPQAVSLIPQLDNGCSSYVQGVVNAAVATTPHMLFSDLIPKNPFTVPSWAKLFSANDPAAFKKKTKTPLLIIQGGNDEQIPVISTQILQGQLCGIGQPVERWVYSGQSHAGVIVPSFDDMLHWIGDRFASTSTVDPYVPTAGGDNTITIAQKTCG
jgi:pimeloyl-ACP methyl ester carboxylesterase